MGTVTDKPRTIADVDRNLATCRAALPANIANPNRLAIIKSLIDDLLEERETYAHCTLCNGMGKRLPGGACSVCDRRRCLHPLDGDKKCTEYVTDPHTRKCPAGHVLP